MVVTLPSVRRTGLSRARPVRALPAARANMTAAVAAVQAMPRPLWWGWNCAANAQVDWAVR